jgi:CBS domain-containing protein
MQNTSVNELMTPGPIFARAEESIQEAGMKMKEYNCGFLPVGSKENVEGVITDRDIVVRAITMGASPEKTTVADCMTRLVVACAPGDSIAEAVRKMREHDVSRLVVIDNDGTACGVLTFGAVLRGQGGREEDIAEVLNGLQGQRPGDAGIAGTVI